MTKEVVARYKKMFICSTEGIQLGVDRVLILGMECVGLSW